MHTCLHMYVYALRLLLNFVRLYHSMHLLFFIYNMTVNSNTPTHVYYKCKIIMPYVLGRGKPLKRLSHSTGSTGTRRCSASSASFACKLWLLGLDFAVGIFFLHGYPRDHEMGPVVWKDQTMQMYGIFVLFSYYPSKIKMGPYQRTPFSKLLYTYTYIYIELLDTQVFFRVRSVGPVGDFLDARDQ